MSRRKIVAGNWKMNLLASEAKSLISAIASGSEGVKPDLIVFPPALFVQEVISSAASIAVGVQNFYPAEKGAFTGEISVAQVTDLAVKYVLVGHSERRIYFNESEAFLKDKVDAALRFGLTVIFCCGEALDVREANQHFSFVNKQIEDSLFHLSAEQMKSIVIAYEPIWAIGTGVTASSAQAEEMHKSIREQIASKFGVETAENLSILYGGSCNPGNASELFACPNVDGGLIGGAALEANSFLAIANAF